MPFIDYEGEIIKELTIKEEENIIPVIEEINKIELNEEIEEIIINEERKEIVENDNNNNIKVFNTKLGIFGVNGKITEDMERINILTFVDGVWMNFTIMRRKDFAKFIEDNKINEISEELKEIKRIKIFNRKKNRNEKLRQKEKLKNELNKIWLYINIIIYTMIINIPQYSKKLKKYFIVFLNKGGDFLFYITKNIIRLYENLKKSQKLKSCKCFFRETGTKIYTKLKNRNNNEYYYNTIGLIERAIRYRNFQFMILTEYLTLLYSIMTFGFIDIFIAVLLVFIYGLLSWIIYMIYDILRDNNVKKYRKKNKTIKIYNDFEMRRDE